MKKDIARSVAMPTIKIITMGMLMWGAHVLTTEPAAGASCYTCSLVGGQADCVEPVLVDLGLHNAFLLV